MFHHLSKWLTALLTAAVLFTCSNPVVETRTETVTLTPGTVTVEVLLPPGTPSGLALAFTGWLRQGSDTFIEPTNNNPPLTFSGVVPGPYTLEVFGKIDGLVYYSASQSANISGSTSLTANLSPTRVLPVSFSPVAGAVAANTKVYLNTPTAGARIHYTTDNTTPNDSSALYTTEGITVTSAMTIKARAYADGLESSGETSAAYSIDSNTVAAPTFSPAAETFTGSVNVTLSSTTSGATIQYSLNDAPFQTYSSPITLNATTTIRAYAEKAGMTTSPQVSKTYTLSGSSNIRIWLYQENTTPKIWLWEINGRAISQLEGGTWPGPNMTREGTSNWYYYEIPSSYYPLVKDLGMKFNGSDPQINLTAPIESSRWRKNNQWYTSNPDAPSISATPGSSTFFTDGLTVTLLANDVTDAEYKIATGSWTSYTNNQQVSLGQGLTAGQTVTLSLRSLTQSLSQSYVYTRGDSSQVISIYFKKTSGNAPTIWYWEENGRALAQLKGFSWPGPSMSSVGGGWYKYDIPSDLYPINLPLKVHFDGGSALTRNPPVTGWYNGSSWSNDNPDPPPAPSVSLEPSGGWFDAASVSVTPTIQVDSRAPLQSARYKINDGSWVNYTSGTINVTLGSNQGDTTSLTFEATNSSGTTSVSAQYRRGTQPLPSFSWKNASIYFVITDRFFDGDTSNNNSYGRPQVDATGKNIGTFHGGDIAGLTAKLNANYFTDLGINVIWITAPYEQAHGFVGGGSAGDFAHYAYHGYYALDFSNIDANMGTRAQFKTFVDTAHSKGIRVILDIVMNHSGYPTLKDMEHMGFNPTTNSNFNWTPGAGQNWFGYHDAVIDYNNATEWGKWWGSWVRAGLPGYTPPGGGDLTMSLAYLPDFKTEDTTPRGLPTFLQNKATYGGAFENPSAHNIQKNGPNRRVRDWIADWLSAWVREYGIDGYRVDTAKHVEMDSWLALRTKSTQALQDWRTAQAAKSAGERAPGWDWEEPFWMVAEVWGHGPNQSNYHTVQGGAFDSVINFSFQGAVGKSGSGPGAASSWESTYSSYANAVNSNPNSNWNFLSYISSHDTGSVFRQGKTDDQQKRAGTMLLLAPGGAQVFYGDEYGRANGDGGSDVDQGSRSSMNWTEIASQASNANSILSHWRKVGRFRNRNIAVGAGTHQQISATGAPYAFVRNWQNTNKVAVAIDASATSVTFTLPNGFWPDGTQVRDYYTGNTATVSGNSVTITGVTVGSPVLLQLASVAYP